MNNEIEDVTLVEIYDLLHAENDESQAKVFGINKDVFYNYKNICNGPDIYQLIDNIVDDRLGSVYDYLGLITYGWAAPLNSEGETDSAPSAHPDRKRVRLLIVTSKEQAGILGTVLLFVNTEEEPVFDYGNANGPLSDVLSQIYN